MNRVFLALVPVFVCLSAGSQPINRPQNQFRSEDGIERQVMELSQFNPMGENGVWHLEEADTFGIITSSQYAFKDSATLITPGHLTYYRLADNGIDLIGTESCMTLIDYDTPERWLQFPMQQGDSVCGYFNGTGKYCDHLFVRRFGNYHTKADMAGTMVLRDGDTLHHVLRLHTERYVSNITTPIDTMRHEIPTFTVDSIISHQATDSLIVREDCYRWYAEGYRYPILEAFISRIGNQTLASSLYYCPPETQEQLALDDENKAIRARAAGSGVWLTEHSGSEGRTSIDETPFQYTIVRQDNAQLLSVRYSLTHATKVEAVIANSLGYVYKTASRHSEAGDNLSLDIDYSDLPRGQYILCITAESSKYTEKVNLK